MPALWLMFSFDLIVLGLIVGVVAYRPPATARIILWIAALAPLAAAVCSSDFSALYRQPLS